MSNLIVLTGVLRGTVHPVGEGAVIGRGSQSDLALADDPMISSRHAAVVPGSDGFELRDLESTNGTYLNGSRVSREIPLREGDILHVGTTELLFTQKVSLDPALTPAHATKLAGPELHSASFDVRLVADDSDEELRLEPRTKGAGLTIMLPMIHRVERSFTNAQDLSSLLEDVARQFARSVGGDGVLIVLEHEGQREVELRAWLKGSRLQPIDDPASGFPVRERLLQRALLSGGALLGRSEGGAMALCFGLPHAGETSGAVYLHGVREELTQEDLRPLLLLANLAGVHCRAHLLVDKLRERNVQLEQAQSRLASWNEELQEAVDSRTAELARSEASYRSLFHESRDGNFTTDRRGRIKAINRTAADLLDMQVDEAVGRPLWLLFGAPAVVRMLALESQRAGEVTKRFQVNLDRLAQVETPDVLEIPLRTLSGKERIVEVLVRPILTPANDEHPPEVDGIHVVLRDATARHEAEEVMRLLSRIVENMKEAVVSTTLDGEVTSWNPGAEELYQYEADEVTGHLLPTVPDDRGAEFDRILSAVAEGHSMAVRTERVARDDRVVPVLATFAPVHDAEGRIVGLIELARDLSDQLELEERMRWRERLASFGELAAGLAHELGNPLANLRSGVEYLLDRPRDPDVAHESLELLHTEIERLHRLVEQTLDLARWKPPQLARIEAAGLVSFVTAVVRDRAAELGIRVVNLSENEAREVSVLGDEDQLKQALLNLVSNAFNAMPDGGQLELSLIGPSQAGEASEAGFQVRDTGCGIPETDQERIFDLFYSSGHSEGSGIGLAVVKRIVDLHQGRLVLESEVGAGTTVQVLLPVAPDREEMP